MSILAVFQNEKGEPALYGPLHINRWPRWARRAFIVTLPVSGPLWVFAALLLTVHWVFAALFLIVIGGPLLLLHFGIQALQIEWHRP